MGGLVRILMILAPYLGASLAAGCVYSVALAFSIGPTDLLNPSAFKGFAAVIVVFGGFVAVFGFPPAFPAIIYAERTGVRSFWFYCYGGALAGIVAYVLYIAVLTQGDLSDMWFVLAESIAFRRIVGWIIVTTAGIAAGLVYWLIAGRRTVPWRRASQTVQPPVR